MALLDNELARRGPEGLALRNGPVLVRWEFSGLIASDGHEFNVVLDASARVLESATERAMFAERLLGGRSIATVHDLRDHFAPPLREAIARELAQVSSDEAAGEGGRKQIIASAAEAARRVAFDCGVEIIPPYRLTLDSPTRERQRIKQARDEMVLQGMERAAALLRRYDDLKAANPALTAADVLRQVGPADQEELLRTLLLAGRSAETSSVWFVSGRHLGRVRSPAPSAGPTPPPLASLEDQRISLMELPDSLGPLRSVASGQVDGRPVLLVGARSGVFLVDPEGKAPPAAYADGGIASPRGFSAACVLGQRLWACHGDGGVVGWDLGTTAAPALAHRPAVLGGTTKVCCLQPLETDRLIFANGPLLWTMDLAGSLQQLLRVEADIAVILLSESLLIVVDKSGRVSRFSRQTLLPRGTDRPVGQPIAAALLPWIDGHRLLLADESGSLCCVGLEDQILTQYRSVYPGLRAVAAAADVIAAISPDRHRLLLWHPWDGRHPVLDLYVLPKTKSRLADVHIA